MSVTEQYGVDPDGTMEQEKTFLAALASVTDYRMTVDRLELLDAADDVCNHDPFKGKWDDLTGLGEFGESPLQAARREVFEESDWS